jgi:hypothetical protein
MSNFLNSGSVYRKFSIVHIKFSIVYQKFDIKFKFNHV